MWPCDRAMMHLAGGASILLQLKHYYITLLLAKMSKAAMKSKEEPKAKRPKLSDDKEAEEEQDDEEEEETPSTNITTTTLERNDDGDAYIELSSKRRCTVRQWKGKVLVDIREVRNTWLAVWESTREGKKKKEVHLIILLVSSLFCRFMKRTERLYREKREFHLPWNNIKCCRLQ
jgi:hypothetical protein